MVDYVGDEICLSEMPQGCVITSLTVDTPGQVVVASPKDALAVIDSLKRMLLVQFGIGED